ncbi:uncharacterized protein LOC132269191 isoform X2 [Cornus florida]|uniref:uncharacterized protein LOC132269191 isoform X2 n=1 Tax=Cornus florida TaxID=4283 RepID=UPI00289D98D8|nr:uncharacterized protein LOC132269191 isoform X2 [Cornus florida]
MCGRARCTVRADDIPRACHLNGRPLRSVNMDRYRPSYNVSPGSNLPVVRREDGSDGQGGTGAVLHCMKWGLIPTFTKKNEKPDHYKMFNARSESICEKASFRRLVPNNRCLVAVEGFYEWKKDGSKKQPYYINFKDGRPLLLAALYDSWKNSEGEILYTFTILTTSSSSALGWLHDRMPVILGGKESSDAWLIGSSSSKFDTLLKPYEEPDLVWYPVTPAMGKPSFDGPECIKEIQLKIEKKNSISKFFSKKEIDDEKVLKPQVGSANEEHNRTSQLKSLKEEPETRDMAGKPSSTSPLISLKKEPETQHNTDYPSSTGECNYNSEPKTAGNPQIKRDLEELSADTKASIDDTKKLCTSPVRKKGNFGGAGDKQPTLFSYFGKR